MIILYIRNIFQFDSLFHVSIFIGVKCTFNDNSLLNINVFLARVCINSMTYIVITIGLGYVT